MPLLFALQLLFSEIPDLQSYLSVFQLFFPRLQTRHYFQEEAFSILLRKFQILFPLFLSWKFLKLFSEKKKGFQVGFHLPLRIFLQEFPLRILQFFSLKRFLSPFFPLSFLLFSLLIFRLFPAILLTLPSCLLISFPSSFLSFL